MLPLRTLKLLQFWHVQTLTHSTTHILLIEQSNIIQSVLQDPRRMSEVTGRPESMGPYTKVGCISRHHITQNAKSFQKRHQDSTASASTGEGSCSTPRRHKVPVACTACKARKIKVIFDEKERTQTH
jgi:hypothetical protein